MRQNDNRNWTAYPAEYAKQIIEDIMPVHDMFITNIDDDIETGNLIFADNLHTNWMDLYNTIFKLQPDTVFEVGCGSGQHLANIQTILPDATIAGCDINSEQINFGKNILNIDPKIYQNVQTFDFSLSTVPQSLGKTFDIVYSQAVLMHLSHSNAYHCLKNMIKISNKYVILLENPDDHDYNSVLDLLNATASCKTKVTYPAMYGSDLYLIEKL